MNSASLSLNRTNWLRLLISAALLLAVLGGCTGDESSATTITSDVTSDGTGDGSTTSDGGALSETVAQPDTDVVVEEDAEDVTGEDGTGADVEETEGTAIKTPKEQAAVSPSAFSAETGIEQPAVADVNPLDQTTNILLLGSDRRPDTPNWRTDVLMIVALDRENGRAGVISIPRDVFIEEIPNHQPDRVNVVDYLGELDDPDGGGPALLSGIIEQNMGIPIHHYLRFSFDSFREVVDALGGVPVDIDCAFQGFIEEEGGWLVLEPGLHRLTGSQALIYVRDRQLTGGDLSRARRQQRFVWAVRNQILDENLLTRIPALYTAFSGSVDTDIGLVTTLQFARLALGLDPEDLHGMVLAPPDMLEEGWAMGMSVFLPDWELISENVHLVFDNPPFVDGNTPEDCR